jgi:hypothetical protein
MAGAPLATIARASAPVSIEVMVAPTASMCPYSSAAMLAIRS